MAFDLFFPGLHAIAGRQTIEKAKACEGKCYFTFHFFTEKKSSFLFQILALVSHTILTHVIAKEGQESEGSYCCCYCYMMMKLHCSQKKAKFIYFISFLSTRSNKRSKQQHTHRR